MADPRLKQGAKEKDKDNDNKDKGKGRGYGGGGKGKSDFLPVPVPTIVPRFDLDDAEGLKYLEDNGYVVFKDIATNEELKKGIELAWDFIESVTPGVKRSDPETYETSKWPDPFGKGIVCGDGAGQSNFMWFVRGLSKVQRVYQKIWSTDEVITSFDGFCIHRPWEYRSEWRTKEGSWYHLDQNGLAKPNKICVQGFLNFYASGETDGGLVVVPKSHTVFNKIFENRPKWKDRGDFVPLYGERSVWDSEVKAAKLSAIKVCAQPGDFVLWDSRVIHCNAPATTTRPLPSDGTILEPRRIVAYVCMTPKSRVKHRVISERIEAYKQGQTTSHWPEDCVTQNARKNKSEEYVPLALTPEQRKLIPM